MKNFIVILSSFFASLAFADHSIQVGKPVVDVASKLISQGTLVVDVRQEACNGYVKGARLLSVDEFLNSPDTAVATVLDWAGGDKNRDVVIYCRSGARSAKALAVLQKRGFTKLHNLGGLGDYFDPETMEKCN